MQQNLQFKGTPYELGLQHGIALRQDIVKTLGLYRSLWGLQSSDLSAAVSSFRGAMRKHCPHLCEEISGIAKGASLLEEEIYALNARTELLAGMSLPECTSAGIESRTKANYHVVIGQNWDWLNDFRGLAKVVELVPENNRRMKMLIEPGMVGKIGMNEDGLGVCFNYLDTSSHDAHGIPVHVLLRMILEQGTSKKAKELLFSVPRASSANYLLGDVSDDICSVETTPETCVVIPSSGIVTHTNSFAGEYCERQETFERALRLFMRDKKLQPQALKDAFSVSGVQFPFTQHQGIETLQTIIMNLTRRRMLVSNGAQSPVFELYEL